MRRYGRKKQGHMAEKYCHNKKKIGEEKTKTREDKQKKNDQTPIFSKLPFLDNYNKKTSTFNFLVHGHSSWSTTGLRLVRGPKALSIDFLRNQIMNEPLKQTPSSMI